MGNEIFIQKETSDIFNHGVYESRGHHIVGSRCFIGLLFPIYSFVENGKLAFPWMFKYTTPPVSIEPYLESLNE